MSKASGLVNVERRLLYIQDVGAAEAGLPVRVGNGLVWVDDACSAVLTGRHTGPVHVTVEVTATPPDLSLDDWDEVVEVSQVTRTGHVAVFDWGSVPRSDLPELKVPAGTSYRLRASAAGRAQVPDHLPSGAASADRYLVQLWPAEPTSIAVHKGA